MKQSKSISLITAVAISQSFFSTRDEHPPLCVFATPSISRPLSPHSFTLLPYCVKYCAKCELCIIRWRFYLNSMEVIRTSEQIKFNGIANHFMWELLALCVWWFGSLLTRCWNHFLRPILKYICCCACWLGSLHKCIEYDDLMIRFHLIVCLYFPFFDERALFATSSVWCAIT